MKKNIDPFCKGNQEIYSSGGDFKGSQKWFINALFCCGSKSVASASSIFFLTQIPERKLGQSCQKTQSGRFMGINGGKTPSVPVEDGK